jgi:predicted amidohydrolase YtcJ
MCLACNSGMVSFMRAEGSRRRFMGGALALASTLAVRPDANAAPSDNGPADILFRGGDILTMDRRGSRAQALAIRGQRILAVGRAEDVQAYRGPMTRIVDLDGRALLPGLIDPHMHFGFVQLDDWVDLGFLAAPSMSDVLDKLRTAALQAQPGGWIRAQGFDPSITRDGRSPTRAELDALSPRNPVFLLESNGHIAFVNSRALEAAGITATSTPPKGSRFVKGSDGELTGRLEEGAAFMPFMARMPVVSADDMRRKMRRLTETASSVGCTTLHDCGIGVLRGADDLALLASVAKDDAPVRCRGMLVSTAMDTWEAMGLRPGFGDDRFRVNGVKAWADGSNQAMTGYQRENYLGRDSRGALNFSPAQLTDSLRRAHRAGWQIGVHANGDAAIDTTIAAYETVLREAPRSDHRHRIEHCSMLHPEQIVRMRELGLSPSFLIGHVRWWGKAFRDRILGPDRARFYDPCASALRGGLRISLHSDYNVTPIEPLRYVEDAAARVMNEGGGVFFPEERIAVEAALRAVTLDAAWQCRMDDICGSLEPGKYADLVILDRDPTKLAATQVRKAKVSETWLAGAQRYAA